jgi:hypothetical protein
METWTWKHETWKHGDEDMETGRHTHDMRHGAMETWKNGHGHRHGHGHMDVESWTWRHGHGNIFFIMYFDYLLEPLPPLYELARPDRWKFDTMLLFNML